MTVFSHWTNPFCPLLVLSEQSLGQHQMFQNLPEYTPCDILDNLRDYQQHSVFTDLTIYCEDGAVAAHKAMLFEVLCTLGIPHLDIVDGLVLPNIALDTVNMALTCLYTEGNSGPLEKICSFIKIEPSLENKDDESKESNRTNLTLSDEEIQSKLKIKIDEKEISINKLKRYTCKHCDYATTHKNRLRRQRLSLHEKPSFHKCEYCDFQANRKYKLSIHKKDIHPELKQQRTIKKLSCDLCDFVAKGEGKSYKRSEGLSAHKRKVHGEKHLCDQCQKMFPTKSNLKRHIQKVHNDNIHSCQLCEYESNKKNNLLAHVRKNHTDEMFYCDKCEFTTRKAFQLKTHIRVKHEGIKLFCEQCDYSAPYTGGLKRHIKRVHEGLSYSCEYCDQKSTTRANLKLHTDAKHLGIKYPCDKCEFKCSQPGSLKIHKQSKH